MKKLVTVCFFLHLQYAYAQVLVANEGIDSIAINAMGVAIQNGTYPNIHSILIAHHDKIVYERYWPGKDRIEGKGMMNLVSLPHAKDSLHQVQSITKSIVSACVGIALEKGKIQSIDQKVFDFFPEYAKNNTGLKKGMTIKDLLTMTAGFSWNEEDYNAADNSEHLMGNSFDPVAYVLSLPMTSTPGKLFNYNGGATQSLAAIVQRATGKPIDDFAKEFLFTPLGITNFKWSRWPKSNLPDATSGLYLRSRDILKFGLLYMHEGKWGSKQIVSKRWVQESLTPYTVADDGSDARFGKSKYGFQWWILEDSVMNKPIQLSACIGNGGQRIFVDKANQLVVVFTGGNYRMPDLYLSPYNMLKIFIYPALFRKEE